MKKISVVTLLLLLSVSFVLMIGSAHAALLVYEGFDYDPVGSDLPDVSSFVDDDPLDATVPVVAPGLSFGDLDVSGNSASLTGTQFWATRGTTPAASFEAGGTWYMSALVRYDTGGATWAAGEMVSASFGKSSFVEGINLGVMPDGNGDAYAYAGVGRSTGSMGRAESGILDRNTTYLLVGKYESDSVTGTPDRANIYLNVYDIATGPPTSESYAFSSLLDDYFWRVTTSDSSDLLRVVKAQTPGSTIIDEIRVADTWADVVPIPEPSTYALVAVALVSGLAPLRRRVR